MNMDYIAGWFDGEGTIHLSKRQKHHLLSFPNTDLKVIEEMNNYFRKQFGIEVEMTEYTPKKYKTVYRITITRQKDVIKILEHLKDKCITKKESCKCAYDYEMCTPRRTNKSWKEDDKKYLIENYNGYGDVVKIAKYMGRSFASVENEVERLKLRSK